MVWAVSVLLAIAAASAPLAFLYGSRKNRTRDASASSPVEDWLTRSVAAIATGVSAEGMWRFTSDVLKLDGPLQIALFAFIELSMVTEAVRARRNMREHGSAGLDGIAVWALACLTAVLSSLDARQPAEVIFRLAAPLVAAWMWERGMRLERRRQRGKTSINWRLTPERVLVRLGIAEARDRTVAEVDAYRKLTRVALAAKKAKALREAGASDRKQRRAFARLDKAMDRAVEHTDLPDDETRQTALLKRIDSLNSTAALAQRRKVASWADPDTDETEPHICPAKVVKVPVTLRRVVEKPVERIVEKPVERERIVEKPVPVTVEKFVEVPTPIVPVDALDAARIAYEHSLTGPGRPLGQRALARRFGIEHRAAEEILTASQEPADESPADASETAPAVTDSESTETPADDRHTTTPDDAPATPDDALTAWLLGTDVSARQEAAADRHSTVSEDADDEPAAPAEDAPPPAAVTISTGDETPASDRRSTTSDEPSEEDREESVSNQPVTITAPPSESLAGPSQSIAFTPLKPVFQEPSAGQPVTVPEAPARPSHNNGMNAFDRALAAAIADHHRPPVRNGARPSTSPTGDQS
jgi:hypothetical protein